jgi:polyvinyl alcohol dehydrogenase (cytochrome)
MFKKLFFTVSLSCALAGCGDLFNMPALTECPASMGGDISQHTIGASSGSLSWPSWGGNPENTHFSGDTTISTANASQLQVKWIYNSAGSISATPTITDNHLYITDWGNGTSISSDWPGGMLHAIDLTTGNAEWSQWMRNYNNDTLNNVSRSSPAIFQDLVIIGDVQNPAPITAVPSLIDRATRFLFRFNDTCGGYIYGINRHNGNLAWSTRIGTQMFDQISQSPVVYNDTVFVGISSHESTYTHSGSVPCCKFRGSFVALDAHTGAIKWRRYMINDSEDYDQYAGAAIWGGAPTIDAVRNSVYLPTGNNYWVPQSVQNCLVIANGDPGQESLCLAGQPDNFFDSIVSLDMDTGAVKWVMNSQTYDAWTTACDFNTLFPLLAAFSSTRNCPTPAGPDADFAQPPMLVRNVDLGVAGIHDVLYAGTKAGEFFAIKASDGSIVWRKQIGPGGLIGGMQFGAATDGQRLYIQNTNFNHMPYTLVAGPLAGTTIKSGFWAALDPVTGNILWQTPVPYYGDPIDGAGFFSTGQFTSNDTSTGLILQSDYQSGIFHIVWGSGLGKGHFNWPMGGLTVANGVVYAGVANLQGTMVAMNASNGTILWQYDTGQSIVSSPAIVNGRIYWGTGYKTGTPGNRLYSLGLP